FERFGHWALLWGIGLAIVATIPWAAQLITAKGGLAFLAGGMGGGLGTFFKSRQGKLPAWLLASLVALLLCYGFLVLAYSAGYWSCPHADLPTPPRDVRWILAILVVLSVVVGLVVNLNYLTLHHYYRDRLMEAFMPDVDNVRQNRSAAARIADAAL